MCCIAVCPRLAILNETSGVITSPFYPRYYPVNQRCSWKISARKGKRINLVIEDMEIRGWGVSCPFDYLQIQNGSYSSNSSSGRICGRLNGDVTFYLHAENLMILFVSSIWPNWHSRGFKATYHQVNSDVVSTGKGSKQMLLSESMWAISVDS